MWQFNGGGALWRLVSRARVDIWIAPVGFEEGADTTREPADATRRASSAAAALTELAARRARLPRESIRVEHDDTGRPVIVPLRWLHASVSHCADYVACAVSDREVGIDIETRERPEADSRLAECVCTAAELEFLAGMVPGRRRAALIRLWTRKEAVVKALGVGLGQPLARADVLGHRPVIDGTRRPSIWIRDIEPRPAGYTAAVAGVGRRCIISVHLVTGAACQ